MLTVNYSDQKCGDDNTLANKSQLTRVGENSGSMDWILQK